MEDVKNRYGYYPQAKYDKNTELKTYFEKLMGKDLNQYFNEKKQQVIKDVQFDSSPFWTSWFVTIMPRKLNFA